jgi:hypothetical protein
MRNPFRRLLTPSQWAAAGVIVACTVFWGCAAAKKDFELADNAVRQFHSQLDSEQYSAIYLSADAKLKQSTSESDFVTLLRNVHSTLGPFQSSALRSKSWAYHTPQTATVRFDYDATFARGSGRERFTWQIGGDSVVLGGYKIESSELVGPPN